VANKKFDQQLAALEQVLQAGASPAAVADLRTALLNRNNYIVAKAAKVAAQLALGELIPDMISALDRFYRDPVKTDPQCWAKHALIQALAGMGHDDSRVYVRGLRHVQMEPVWGKHEDTAGRLRASCALALAACRDLDNFGVLVQLLESLADADHTVRMEAARAIGQMGCREGALLLRLRALTGDPEPEVLGACFSALLAAEGNAGIGFVAGFLGKGDDVAGEAALALGALRNEEALAILKERWQREGNTPFGGVLLAAIALTRQPQAFDLLVELIEQHAPAAAAAARALESVPLPAEARARLDVAMAQVKE